MSGDSGTTIVHGHNGDPSRVSFSRILRWLPGVATAAVLAILAQGFLMWREQAVTNQKLTENAEHIKDVTEALRQRIAWSDDHFVTRSEWIAAKAAQDDALVNGLAGIERELGYIANGQKMNRDVLIRNTAILEKLPEQKIKK